MKKVISLTLFVCLFFCMTGCSNKVNSLIADGKYEEALVIIEEDPKKHLDVYDEVRYNVASKAFLNKEYDYAFSLLQDNTYNQASDLLNEVKYHLAIEAIENEEYELAVNYLEGNSCKNARGLLGEAKYLFAEHLLKTEEYEKAITLLDNNGYKDARDLLKYAYNLQAAIRIEAFYNEMLAEIDEHNPDKWIPSFDYMNGTDFYLRICDMLDKTYDLIVRDESLDNANELFAEIFGYYPATVEQAKRNINDLKEDLDFENFYDSPFNYYKTLHYVMSDLGLESKNVRFEMTETRGFMIIEKPHTFLKESQISAKTFAYLLGSCKNLGATVERDKERIIITYENSKSSDYYSRGYYYCVPNSKHSRVSAFYLRTVFDHYDAYFDDDGLRVTIEFSNEFEYMFNSFSLNLILLDKNWNHVECTSALLFDVNDKAITTDILFKGVTADDLPESQYGIYYFLSAVTE